MGQKPGAGDPFEGLPIGTVISEDGLILSVPGGATDPKGRSTLGQVGTDFTRGGVKGIAGSLLSTAQQAGTTLAAANPVTFPLWLANKVGLVPKSVQQKVLPFAMPGYLPPEVQQQVDTSLQSKNLPETLGGFAADAATAFIGGGGGGLGPRIGRAVAEFLPVTKSKTLANVADKIGRGVTGRVGTPAALTEAEVAQAQSLRSIMPTQKSARTLQAEVRATTPPPNKSPINMRKIYRDEVPKRKGRNSRRQSTPEQVENTALRMMEEVEKRKGVSPFKDVATKMQAAADAPMAPPHWTELGAVLGPLLGTKALIPSGAGRLLGRPLPRGIASHVLSEYAGMAPLVGGERIRRETAGRVPDPAEELRAGIINQLGQGGPELAAGVPSHEPAAAPALPPPAATPPPAPAAAPGLPRPNVAPVPLGRGLRLSAPPGEEEEPDELAAELGPRSYRDAITDLLGQAGRAELPMEEAARPGAPAVTGGPSRPAATGIQSPTKIQPKTDTPEQRQGLADGSLLRVVHPVSGEDGVIPNTFRDIEDAKRKGWNIEVGRDATMRR